MNNVKWLVEVDAFDEGSSEGIVAALKAQNIPYKPFKTVDYFDGRYNHFEPGECVFFYGSVQVAKAIQERNIWKPGIIGNFPNYRCSAFYSQLGDKMLSSEHFFAPFSDLKRLWSFYQKCFDSDCLFLRPDGGDKLFTGQVVEDFELFFKKEYVYLSEFNTSESMCLVANAFKIDAEYRLMVSNGKVVTGSQYRLNGKVHRNTHIPDDVIAFAEDALTGGFAPDDAFILDVCESQGNLFFLEVNPISCAGLYAINPEIFVSTINETIAKRLNHECIITTS